MVNQKQLSTKLKSTPKMAQIAGKTLMQKKINTPATPVVNDKQEGFAGIIRKFVKEEFKAHEQIVSEILKSNLKTTNERLEKISTEVVGVKKES